MRCPACLGCGADKPPSSNMTDCTAACVSGKRADSADQEVETAADDFHQCTAFYPSGQNEKKKGLQDI